MRNRSSLARRVSGQVLFSVVRQHTDHSHWPTIRRQEMSNQVQPAKGAVLSAETVRRVKRAARRHSPSERLPEGVGIVGMDEVLEQLRLAERAVGSRVSEIFVHPLVFPNSAVGLNVPLENAQPGCLQGQRQAFVTLTQMGFGLSSRRDVFDNRDEVIGGSVRFVRERDGQVGPTTEPLLPTIALLSQIGLNLTRQHSLHSPQVGRQIVPVGDVAATSSSTARRWCTRGCRTTAR